MKQENLISRTELPEELGRLENFLINQLSVEQLWPLEGLNNEAVKSFVNSLYLLAWECLAIHSRENMPSFPSYRAATFYSGDFLEMIQVTRQLVKCCDELLIEEYRYLTFAELETIYLLGQLHNAMIGHFYFQHPGMETVGTNEVRFKH